MLADRANRAVLTAWGLVFAAGGAAILAAGAGAGGPALAAQPVLTRARWALVAGNETASWAAVVAGGVILLALGVLWLVAQARTDRLRRLEIDPDRGHGGAHMDGQALAGAVSAELDKTPGLQRGRARLVSRRGGPELHLRVRLSPYADLHEARHHIEAVVIPRARQALAPAPLPALLRLEIARSGERVR
ncbi:MAG TPA: hypothetical protein VKV80_08160 [Streptosporangiaceae bacterium]|nr:hypothetical protein [Streptosporangiaceae bacterium]